MAKTCPRCRLYSPDSAQRCDCGYDFDSGQVERSYVVEDLVRKHGGVPKMLRAAASPGIVTGSVLLGVSVIVWAGSMLSGLPVGVPLVLVVGGVVQLTRGIGLRMRASREEARNRRPL